MKKTLLLFIGLMMAQWAASQTVVVLDLPDPCSGMGVEEWNDAASALSFDIYPNPTDEGVTLTVVSPAGSLGKLAVEVADLRGRAVLKKEFYSAHERLQTLLELETLEAGMYVVTLRSTQGMATRKIVKK